MASYEYGIKFIIEDKDIIEKDFQELEKIISKFLLDKKYNNCKIHRIGYYNKNLEPIWKNCKDVV